MGFVRGSKPGSGCAPYASGRKTSGIRKPSTARAKRRHANRTPAQAQNAKEVWASAPF